jgi:hypothetical protein
MNDIVAIFQPIVSITRKGEVDTDWFQSYIWCVDSGGNDIDDVLVEEFAIEFLDQRLADISEELESNDSLLAELVRPFFESKEQT